MVGHSQFRLAGRRGFITPLIAVALLVVMAAIALVLDRLWLDAAMVELTGTAESSALAAGRQLAGDDLLRPGKASQHRIDQARQAAARIAERNLVAGHPVTLDTDPDGDIRFGRLVLDQESGRTKFLQTRSNPSTVVVTAKRTRSRNNPLALLFAQLTRQPAGDVATRVEATIDNRVIGVRPFDGVAVPGFPLAILKSDPEGKRKDTWDAAIEQRCGQDRYSFDVRTVASFYVPTAFRKSCCARRRRGANRRTRTCDSSVWATVCAAVR